MNKPWISREKKFKWIPLVDFSKCDGCQKCRWSCPVGCFEIVDGVAVVASPVDCISEETCIGVCPKRAIFMEWVECFGDEETGRWL